MASQKQPNVPVNSSIKIKKTVCVMKPNKNIPQWLLNEPETPTMKRQRFCITKITMWQHTLQVNDLKIQLHKHNIYIVAICFYPGHSRHEYWFIQNIDHSPWRHGDDRSKRYPTVRLYRINIDIRISPNQSLWSEEEWSGYYVSW